MAGRQVEVHLDDAPVEVDGGSRAGADASPLERPSDLAAGLAELGLTPRATWYSSAVLYGVGGALGVGLHLINSQQFPSGAFVLGCGALAIAALCLFAGLRLSDSALSREWTTHARLIGGLAIYATAVAVLGDKFVAFALLPLLTLPNPCYLYRRRIAIPYVFVTASIVCVGLLKVAAQARVAHALITTLALTLIAASIMLIKGRTRRLASENWQLAYTDPLTGLANMRSLRERISALMGRPGGFERPFALFAIDLDNFKQVNDRFDHTLGDQVLCAVSAALGDELEPGDLAVRRGGDEFSVLVPDPAERDLDALVARLERAIVRARVATCPAVTPSGTVAYIRTRASEELGAMMERADQALHDAKVKSRERRRRQAQQSPAAASPVNAEPTRPIAGSGAPAEHLSGSSHIARARAARGVAKAATEAIGHANPLWRVARVLFALSGLTIAVASLGQAVEPLTPAAGSVIAAGFLALAIACTWAIKSGVSPEWLHLPWAAAYGLTGLAILLAGSSGTALLDLLPVIVIYGFLLFKARIAAFYLVLGQGLYGLLAISGGFAQSGGRTVISVVAIAAVGGVIAKLRLVTVRLARTNRELSEVDALTGVSNLRALRDRIVDVAQLASSEQLHPLIVAIDLDEFKQVNDTHSHATGDRVLVAVARAVSERVRIDELVARRGGDEFFVVIKDADPPYADALVQRIADAIATARTRLCPDIRPTASVTSVRWQPGETPDAILHTADIALHYKKAESRLLPNVAQTAARASVSTHTLSTSNLRAVAR